MVLTAPKLAAGALGCAALVAQLAATALAKQSLLAAWTAPRKSQQPKKVECVRLWWVCSALVLAVQATSQRLLLQQV